MGLGKKGAFFTFSALLLVIFLFTSYASIFENSSRQSQYSETNRLDSMNSFLLNLDKETSHAIYISTFRGIIAIINEIVSTGNYVPNSESTIYELITNGTLNGNPSYLMEDNTLSDWKNSMISQAKTIGINLEMEFSEINIYQDNPWEVHVECNLKVLLKDNRDIAYWNTSLISIADISIVNFEDPFFVVESGGKLSRQIKISPFYGNFNDTEDLVNHTNSGYYIPFADAPSFLQRLEGDFSSNEFGIESLIDKSELAKHISVDESKTNVDYLYFSTKNPISYDILGMTDNFRLDNTTGNNLTHLEEYNAISLIS